jgi:hypothetical protein
MRLGNLGYAFYWLSLYQFELAGFAPTGELIGWSKANLWASDRGNHALRILFTAPIGRNIRYDTRSVLISLAPQGHPADSTEETLNLLIHYVIKLT